jgi:anti-sigma B factor antagonist
MAGGLEVKSERQGDAVIVSPQGEIAYTEATVFRNAIKKAGDEKPGRIVVDLSRVDYMNTPGVAVLVEALQAARKNKTRLVLCGINQRVLAIFQIARLNTVFEIVDSRDAALAPKP